MSGDVVDVDVDVVDVVDVVVVHEVKVVASASASVSASAADDGAVFAVGPEVWESGEGAESVVVEAEELSPLAVLPCGCRV